MKRQLIVAVTLWAGAVAHANEVDFQERFALAEDREAVLQELIPGTRDYYYYNAVQGLNTERYDAVRALLRTWIDRHGRTRRVQQIEDRLALLTYPRDPKASLDHLRRRLGLRFDHQRQTLEAQAALPSALDPALISREALTRRALSRRSDLGGFEARALPWVAGAVDLDEARLRDLLRRLPYADGPNVVALVARELGTRRSRGFGQLPIHAKLTAAQLEELAQRRPELRNDARYVAARLQRLRPGADAPEDRATALAFLRQAWDYVKELAPAHNSLKAHILYHRLALERTEGTYDEALFQRYLELPRPAPYMDRDALRRRRDRREWANLHADYRAQTGLPPIGDDQALVREFLTVLLRDADSPKAFADRLDDDYLERLFAEVKLLYGLGDPERWYSMLPPAQVKAIQERVELTFAPTSPDRFAADADVALELDVKNVPQVLVKVYELNAAAYYRDTGREIDTDIDLDGLVPNHELSFSYEEPPVRRVRRRFAFPQLQRAGVYVIDVIGNGQSSRAVIRKGTLRRLLRTTPAGQTFTILDEGGKPLPDARLWLQGKAYAPDADGTITVPFSTSPGRRAIVLSDGPLSVLDRFDHQAEGYSLAAGFYVDREALVAGRKAEVALRVGLFLNGTPVSPTLLEEVRLGIASTDLDGVSASTEVGGIELSDAGEATHTFAVPPRLTRLSFTLQAKVPNLSQGRKDELSARHDVQLNGMDATARTEALYLRRGATFSLEVRGKTGERKRDRPVRFRFKHRDFTEEVNAVLKTDARGRIELGALEGIERLRADGPEGATLVRALPRDRHVQPPAIHARAGDPIAVAFMGASATRDVVGLVELRGGVPARDRFDALALSDGLLRLKGLEPGDYRLLLKDAGEQILVRVAEGERAGGYVVGAGRSVELRDPAPLQIKEITGKGGDLVVALTNASPQTRVHVLAGHYVPVFDAFGQLAAVRDAYPSWGRSAFVPSAYVAGRTLGDEYRYVLERRQATRLPGNMLERPQLLLNPWAIRDTSTDTQEARLGEQFGAAGGGRSGAEYGRRRQGRGRAAGGDSPTLDFLAEPALVRLNLRPDAQGRVRVPLKDLGKRVFVQAIAVDAETTAARSTTIGDGEAAAFDRRLRRALDPKRPATERRQVTFLKKGARFELADVTSARLEAYDSLAKAYRLLLTLSGDETLAEFGWVLGWPGLSRAEKRARYSSYACHELNLFLAEKDPAFFAQVVKPYLANKLHKTFLDRYLLGTVTAEDLRPWAYGRLNAVERILLARSLKGELPATRRHLQDRFDLLPPRHDWLARLFQTALAGSALDDEDALGLRDAKDRAAPEELLREKKMEDGLAKSSRRAARNGFAEGAAEEMELDADEAFADEPMAEPAEEPAPAAAPPPAPAKPRGRWRADEAKRKAMRQLYRKLETTKEWVENNYYHLPIEEQDADLVTINGFWLDFARSDPGAPFVSTRFPEASRNFTEMMLALAVLDLPFDAPKHPVETAGKRMTLTAAGPAVLFHEQVTAAERAGESPILVSQRFFRNGDRYRIENGERIDKFVSGEFLIHTVYGGQVVVTNPTSSRRSLNVLLQVPEGAIPVLRSHETRSVPVRLEPYRTVALEYFFYFPRVGTYAHCPAQVAQDEQVVAAVDPVTFRVVAELSKKDTGSWDYISQYGSAEQVIAFLKANPVEGIDLSRIAWRMRDRALFQRTIGLLAGRHAFDETLWSYALFHDVPAAAQDFLAQQGGFADGLGGSLHSRLLVVDPVLRKTYQHMEYKPLVNARAHPLGGRRRILNDRFRAQYERLMAELAIRPALDDEALLQVTYYLLLQDRVPEAQRFFGRIDPKRVPAKLQYDYLRAYLDFFAPDPDVARTLANRYADCPVDRWRVAFEQIAAQVAELDGAGAQVSDPDDRTQSQTALAASEPVLDLSVEARKVTVRYANVEEATVRYYPMDVELLFSQSPFGQEVGSKFAYVRPALEQQVRLPGGSAAVTFPLPDAFQAQNLLVEVSAGGRTRSRAYYANALDVSLSDGYGQLRVTHTEDGKPLPATYVKVYARLRGGEVRFYKDGYTDLRGRFDYASLSTDELDRTERFAILVLSDEHGARVEEVAPPRR